MSEVRFAGLVVVSDKDAWRTANKVDAIELRGVMDLMAEHPSHYDLALLCVRLLAAKVDGERKLAIARAARDGGSSFTPACVDVRHPDILPESTEFMRLKARYMDRIFTLENALSQMIECCNSEFITPRPGVPAYDDAVAAMRGSEVRPT